MAILAKTANLIREATGQNTMGTGSTDHMTPEHQTQSQPAAGTRQQAVLKFSGRMLLPAIGFLALSACSPEMGRRITDSDVSCLRTQMGTAINLSFPLAANTCQRTTAHNMIFNEKDAKLIPLNLHGAPDLQKLAKEYDYSYTD